MSNTVLAIYPPGKVEPDFPNRRRCLPGSHRSDDTPHLSIGFVERLYDRRDWDIFFYYNFEATLTLIIYIPYVIYGVSGRDCIASGPPFLCSSDDIGSPKPFIRDRHEVLRDLLDHFFFAFAFVRFDDEVLRFLRASVFVPVPLILFLLIDA